MSKSADAFRTISEVADWLGVQAHVLRFWESKFTQIKPVKRAGGRRYYRPADMLLLGGIRKLLHKDGLSIKEVQAILRDLGIGHVSEQSHDLDSDAPPADGAQDGGSGSKPGHFDASSQGADASAGAATIEASTNPAKNAGQPSAWSANPPLETTPASSPAAVETPPKIEAPAPAPEPTLQKEATPAAELDTPSPEGDSTAAAEPAAPTEKTTDSAAIDVVPSDPAPRVASEPEQMHMELDPEPAAP
ncbi:MerR family transcriptional regulator, partial [Pseudophaeobacter sp.]|uniref:MerR family transcriptional regulator n=1 Tax=Pseudophaeobacter sp. TaxID=1971739 RepID=UPI003299054C